MRTNYGRVVLRAPPRARRPRSGSRAVACRGPGVDARDRPPVGPNDPRLRACFTYSSERAARLRNRSRIRPRVGSGSHEPEPDPIPARAA